eukprot:m.10644 g.10644  ORF g.10644 m.10644 type:complete len:64 (+) comp9639_c0_seq1:93-284(+)
MSEDIANKNGLFFIPFHYDKDQDFIKDAPFIVIKLGNPASFRLFRWRSSSPGTLPRPADAPEL